MFPTRRITLGGDKFRDEYSLSFDGTDDYVDTGASFQSTWRDSFSIALWIQVDDGQPSSTITMVGTKNSADEDNTMFQIHSSGKLRLFYKANNDPLAVIESSPSFSNGVNLWAHVAVTVDKSVADPIVASGVKTYVNGIETSNTLDLGGTTFSNMAAWTSSDEVFIGANDNNGTAEAFVDGKISDVTIYSTALTSSQIKTIYNGREPYNHKEGVASSNLVSWWRMGDGRLDTFNIIGDEVTPTIGSNVATGTFSEPTGWSESGGTLTATSATADPYMGSVITNSKLYKVSYTITVDSGTMRMSLAGKTGTTRTSSGSFVEYLTSGVADPPRLFVEGVSAFTGTVSNIIVQPVNGNAGLMTNMTADDFTGDTP